MRRGGDGARQEGEVGGWAELAAHTPSSDGQGGAGAGW